MTISVNITNESADGLLDDLRRIFPALVAGGPLTPAQPATQEQPQAAEPRSERKPRSSSKKDAATSAEASSTEKTSSTGTASTAADTGAADIASPSEAAPEIPDIEDLRAKLKTLGATDGFGHDKVFEVLGKYNAKNASTVPEARRAECINEIDALLKAGPVK
jgi:hypothetical protein